MPLANLAVESDLLDRGVAVTDGTLADTMLAVASSLVREAAGSPISETATTFTTWALERGCWLGLAERVRPVTAVTSVTLDGSAVGDYKLVDGDLWRSAGWCQIEPAEVVIAATVGFPDVPEHIRQLVCDLAILGINTAAEGAHDPTKIVESIDDYSVTFAKGADTVASAMTIPALTRLGLRSRFGGGLGSVRFLA